MNDGTETEDKRPPEGTHRDEPYELSAEYRASVERDRLEFEALTPAERQPLVEMADDIINRCRAGEELRFLFKEAPKHLLRMVDQLQMERAEVGVKFHYVSCFDQWNDEAIWLPWCFTTANDLKEMRAR